MFSLKHTDYSYGFLAKVGVWGAFNPPKPHFLGLTLSWAMTEGSYEVIGIVGEASRDEEHASQK